MFITTTTIGRPWRTIASNSPIVKPAAPSPVMHTTLLPGAVAVPIAGAEPHAHAPQPAVREVLRTRGQAERIVQPVLTHGTVADDERVVPRCCV